MKRSEALSDLKSNGMNVAPGRPWWDAMLEYAETRLGVVWDPEGPELPEQVAFVRYGELGHGRVELPGGDLFSPQLWYPWLAEAVRRYNLLPELEKRIRRIVSMYGTDEEEFALIQDLVNLLDGKEPTE